MSDPNLSDICFENKMALVRRRRRTALSVSCPCRVFVRKVLSDVCPLSGFCPVSVCPDSVCLDFVRCPDSVRISRKKSVRCLTGLRIFKNQVSAVCLSGFRPDIIRPVSGFSKIYCPLSVCSDFAHT